MMRVTRRWLTMLGAGAVLCGCPGPGGNDGGSNGGDGGFFLEFSPPSGAGVSNAFLVTITGEGAATEGVAFPPPGGSSDPYFLDGWELSYEHVLVTVDAVTLAENPDLNPQDQSQTGAVVASASGPWAVDLAQGGPLTSKEMNGKSVALVRIVNQNRKTGNPAFDVTSKYAFGFDLIAAREGVRNVNLDDEAQALYRAMADGGHSVWLQGTATWKASAGAPACRSTSAGYDFGRFPKAVHFAFGFKAPVTYKNCVNPELSPADSRGVQSQTNAETVAQMTFHLDHPYWEALQEDAPLRWDALAARRSVAADAGPSMAQLSHADLVGLDLQSLRDAQNTPLPWRTCGPAQAGERTTGTVAYDPGNVPVNPAGGAAGLKDLLDYMTYNLATFGHLNNDGLCFPSRNYPSPR